ncbi:MAG: hypothetical protein AAFX99_20080, partial [Myxococcota bacterium]
MFALATPHTALAQEGWFTSHRDTSFTGRMSGAGAITEPTVVLKANIGGSLPDRAVRVVQSNTDGSVDAVMVVGNSVLYRNSRQ